MRMSCTFWRRLKFRHACRRFCRTNPALKQISNQLNHQFRVFKIAQNSWRATRNAQRWHLRDALVVCVRRRVHTRISVALRVSWCVRRRRTHNGRRERDVGRERAERKQRPLQRRPNTHGERSDESQRDARYARGDNSSSDERLGDWTRPLYTHSDARKAYGDGDDDVCSNFRTSVEQRSANAPRDAVARAGQ